MTAARVSLMSVGLALIGYGGLLVLLENPWPVVINIAVWAGAGVVIHDFLFAPLCLAVGLAGRRWLPRAWHGPFAVAALVSVVLALLAIPVFNRPGARLDNPTVLDRDYQEGLGLALLAVWAVTACYVAGAAIKARRRARSDPRPAPWTLRPPR